MGEREMMEPTDEPLILCEGCQRHARASDEACPFCGASLRGLRALPALPPLMPMPHYGLPMLHPRRVFPWLLVVGVPAGLVALVVWLISR